MTSMEEAVFLLEKVFSRLESLYGNLQSEKEFLYHEIEKRDEILKQLSQYRRLTLEKLSRMKQVLSDEIKMDGGGAPGQRIPGKLNILMAEDE